MSFVALLAETSRKPSGPAHVRTVNHSRLGEALITLDGPRLRALLVACNNPAVTCPTAAAVRRGLAREDLFDAHPHHLYIADDACAAPRSRARI